ncbi:MAG TPA: hypothetical protein VGB64_08105 [Actinomycetota bacterium]
MSRSKTVAAVAALLAGVLVPAPGRSFSVLAECGGVAGPYPLAASCQRSFGFEPFAKTVRLGLEPSTGFTGTLRAQVSGPGAGFGVGGVFVNGTLVPGTGVSSLTFTLPPGLWQLAVDAGKPAKACPAGCVEVPALAFGPFNAAVLEA